MTISALRCSGMAALLCLFFPAFSSDIRAQEVQPGLYRAVGAPDVASRLLIEANGNFRYMLSAGALDEHAEGHWKRVGDGIELYTDPKPVPPEFVVQEMAADKDSTFTLHVSWPDGQGIAGVDFRIGLSDGNMVEGYTQSYGWTMSSPQTELLQPQWIELSEPFHGTASPRFPVAAGVTVIRITLVPNDMGVVNFEGARVTWEDDVLVLRHRGGMLRYRRADE